MKTRDLALELSSLALNASGDHLSPSELLGEVRGLLSQHSELLGMPTGDSRHYRDLGADLQLTEHRLDFERHSVEVQLVKFLPRDEWQVQGVRVV